VSRAAVQSVEHVAGRSNLVAQRGLRVLHRDHVPMLGYICLVAAEPQWHVRPLLPHPLHRQRLRQRKGTSRSAKPCGDTVQPSNIIPVPILFQLDLHRYPLQEALQLFTGVVNPSETIQLRIASGSWKSPFETIATSDIIVRLPRISDHVMMLTL